MLLGRLRIRARLALLVLVPLLAVLPVTLDNTLRLKSAADRATATADAVRRAQLVGTLMRSLQQERLVVIGRGIGETSAGELMLAEAATDEAAAAVARAGLPTVDTAVEGLSLTALRAGSATLAPVELITSYSRIGIAMVNALHMLDAVDGDTPQGRQVIALDASLRSNEGFSILMTALAAARSPGIQAAFIEGLIILQPAGQRFIEYASAEQQSLYEVSSGVLDARLGEGFRQGFGTVAGSTVGLLNAPPSFRDITSLIGTSWYVEVKIATDALAAAEGTARQDNRRALIFLLGAIVNLLIAGSLSVVIGRSVSVPLIGLTRSAERVARLAEAELIRVADDDSAEAPPPRIQPIVVSGRDELSTFARAFGRVQETAAQLVERQVASRRNVALMFRHVGRRTQNLVGRQISLIDKLESAETDPNRLEELYRLDHISSRLRRNASSLVVLSGATSDERVAPVSVDEVIRFGLAEIERYARVDIDIRTNLWVAPALVNDLALLLAELMENATFFSPPGTHVVVTADSTPDGVRLHVIDHGLGMTPPQLEEENARLRRRERLDLAPTEVLGLFVVGRLARRHGLFVGLTETQGGGVTATVDVPAQLLTLGIAVPAALPAAPPPSPAPPVAPASQDPWALAADPAALDRAAETMRTLAPWNAFDTHARPELMAPAALASPPSIPRPAWPNREPVANPLAPLRKRVPGATLDALGGTSAILLAPMATTSADQARDSLADFESGIARAMRDLSTEGNPP